MPKQPGVRPHDARIGISRTANPAGAGVMKKSRVPLSLLDAAPGASPVGRGSSLGFSPPCSLATMHERSVRSFLWFWVVAASVAYLCQFRDIVSKVLGMIF